MLVDNGSTDETGAILDRYRSDSRIRITRYEQNQKHTVVSNRAIRESSGQFVTFLYGDDYYLPRKLEAQVARFAELPANYGVVYCHTFRLKERSQDRVAITSGRCRGYILKDMLQAQPFEPIAPMVRRECCQRYPFNETVFMEGESLFSKIAMTYAFDYVDEFLGVMRDHEVNMGKEIGRSLARNVILVDELFSHADFPSEHKHLRDSTLAWMHRVKGWQVIRTSRDFERGREWLATAVRHETRSLLNLRVILGLSLSLLPRPVSYRLIDAANRAFGTPAGPPPGSAGEGT
jgi:glycosyltransferase involved in cell wall biosynthesis